MKVFLIAVVVAVLIFLGFYAYREANAPTVENGSNQVFCTMDAKLCPDGSYVGRQGPKCEFAACPGQPNPNP